VSFAISDLSPSGLHQPCAMPDACRDLRRHVPCDLRAGRDLRRRLHIALHSTATLPDACGDLRGHLPRDLRAGLHACGAVSDACRDLPAQRNLRAWVPDPSCDVRANLHADNALRDARPAGLPVPVGNPRPVLASAELPASAGRRGSDGGCRLRRRHDRQHGRGGVPRERCDRVHSCLSDALCELLRDLQSPVLDHALRDLLCDLQSRGVLDNPRLPGRDRGVPGEPRVPRTGTGPRPVHGPADDGVGPHLSLPDDAMVRAVKQRFDRAAALAKGRRDGFEARRFIARRGSKKPKPARPPCWRAFPVQSAAQPRAFRRDFKGGRPWPWNSAPMSPCSALTPLCSAPPRPTARFRRRLRPWREGRGARRRI